MKLHAQAKSFHLGSRPPPACSTCCPARLAPYFIVSLDFYDQSVELHFNRAALHQDSGPLLPGLSRVRPAQTRARPSSSLGDRNGLCAILPQRTMDFAPYRSAVEQIQYGERFPTSLYLFRSESSRKSQCGFQLGQVVTWKCYAQNSGAGAA